MPVFAVLALVGTVGLTARSVWKKAGANRAAETVVPAAAVTGPRRKAEGLCSNPLLEYRPGPRVQADAGPRSI